MKNFILTTVLFASSILGLDLTFVSDANCTGRAFYGRQDLPSISCYDMSYLDPTDSVIVANVSSGERVTFFSDTACQNQLYSTGTNVCYTESDSQVRSFQVRTADTPAAEDDAASTSTDVVPYGVRLSNYKGLSQAGPDSINIMLSQFAIGIIVGVTAQLVALSAIATGFISWVGAYLAQTAGANINEAIQMASGTFSNAKRKWELVNEVKLHYMSGIMKRDGLDVGEH